MYTPGGPSCLLICILVAVKTVETSSDFCNVTRSTKKVVPTCPDSLDKWNEASKRKNCTQYASQCSEPEKLEYHCVINPFINETLEVCAYGQNIISGHCTEYSSSGNLIQPNLNTNCMNFSSNPCPVVYKSTEAYKYPGCYDLTNKTTVTEQTEAKSYLKSTTVASYASSSQIFVKVDNEDNAERLTGVFIAVFVPLLLTSGLLTLLVWYLKEKTYRSRGSRYSVKDFEKNSNEVLPLTNVENENGNVQ
uniref:Chitin-binding type-2 domain-containing protein n=1 Tax=Magallana gigas TaxID=29159 RepID=A0A8W8MLE9_MAGGI